VKRIAKGGVPSGNFKRDAKIVQIILNTKHSFVFY